MAASTFPPDTVDHISALMSSLQHFQDSGSYTDLSLQAEEGEVRCHKAVLAPFSPLLWELCHMVGGGDSDPPARGGAARGSAPGLRVLHR